MTFDTMRPVYRNNDPTTNDVLFYERPPLSWMEAEQTGFQNTAWRTVSWKTFLLVATPVLLLLFGVAAYAVYAFVRSH